jgi:hypothetical protein
VGILVGARRRSVFGLRKHTLDSFYLFGRQKRLVFDHLQLGRVNNLFVANPCGVKLQGPERTVIESVR